MEVGVVLDLKFMSIAAEIFWRRLLTLDRRAIARWLLVGIVSLCASKVCRATEPEQFFEQRVHPILAGTCAKCHSGASPKGGLDATSREGLLRGGKRGPAIVPGDSEASRLIQAVRHSPAAELKMPPKEALPSAAVADLSAWIAEGAPWPKAHAATDDALQHWSLLPPQESATGRAEAPSATAWIDAAIAKRAGEAGLTLAPPADRGTLIRRMTYDLLGLPPTPEEVQAFVNDDSEQAVERVVDRLLANPRYGERWARHWLDLVRYADTDGHEFDTDKPNAFRYRDYVIDAFNRDVPYGQFVREQIAGDLLPAAEQRASADGGLCVSPIGTCFWQLGETQNNPVDMEREQANQVENQLDVLGKAVLGLTIGCARCHDHKTDPIATVDYYALAGFLYSSEKSYQCVDNAARVAEQSRCREEFARIAGEQAALARRANEAAIASRLNDVADYLLASRRVLRREPDLRRAEIEFIADRDGLNAARLERWTRHLERAADHGDELFWAWSRLITADDRDWQGAVARLLAEIPRDDDDTTQLAADFDDDTLNGWERAGAAFVATVPSDSAVTGIVGASAAGSLNGPDALTGRLTSKRFAVPKPYLSFRIAGGKDAERLRLSLCINGQALGALSKTGRDSKHLETEFVDVHTLVGKEAYLEIVDESREGGIAVDEIRWSDQPPSAAPTIPQDVQAAMTASGSARELARSYQELLSRSAAARGRTGIVAEWLARDDQPLCLADDELGDFLAEPERQRWQELTQARARLEQACPESAIALVTREGIPQDAWQHLRGEHTSRGPRIARGVLPAVAPSVDSIDRTRSGRLELAQWLTSPENPLTTRVIVNRVWQHHFGAGLVPTSDNFGVSGQPPSHPQLLDDLALWLMRHGWSLKQLHRSILLSATYQQAATPSRHAMETDAENRLLSHWSPQRLDAECIRDALLAVAGNLNPAMGGPSVPWHVPAGIEGRDVPTLSGPLDGDRRRSIYLEVRRNHLTGLLADFGFPRPTGTVGVRSSSSMPSQALALLNHRFVADQAKQWAKRILESAETGDERVARMYWEAFARPPVEAEQHAALTFVERQRAEYTKLNRQAREADLLAWADLAQALINTGEFIVIR